MKDDGVQTKSQHIVRGVHKAHGIIGDAPERQQHRRVSWRNRFQGATQDWEGIHSAKGQQSFLQYIWIQSGQGDFSVLFPDGHEENSSPKIIPGQ